MITEFSICAATIQDKNSIIEFIKTDWSENHIFVKDPAFFEYFYRDGEQLNFIIGKNPLDGKLEGILGFQPYSSQPCEDIFLALWKVRKGCADTSLGLKLLEYLKKKFNPKNLHCLGINKKTVNIYKFLGYKVDSMNHYCLFNPKSESFKISSMGKFSVPNLLDEDSEGISITKIDSSELEEYDSLNSYYTPVKSKSLFIKKYFNHPYYEYGVYKIIVSKKVQGYLVLRKVTVESNSCYRVIDYVGNEGVMLNAVQKIASKLFHPDVEYLDLYISKKINVESTGFVLPVEHQDMIVPNYFEPFEKRNVEIYYFTSCWENTLFFKGDGDQDRPSIARRMYADE